MCWFTAFYQSVFDFRIQSGSTGLSLLVIVIQKEKQWKSKVATGLSLLLCKRALRMCLCYDIFAISQSINNKLPNIQHSFNIIRNICTECVKVRNRFSFSRNDISPPPLPIPPPPPQKKKNDSHVPDESSHFAWDPWRRLLVSDFTDRFEKHVRFV